MDTDDIQKLCLRHMEGAALTEAEATLVDSYSRTPDGQSYVREAREIMDALRKVADVPIEPIDPAAMIQRFEQTVRQTFETTVIRPPGGTYSLPISLGLLAGVFILIDGWTVLNVALLGFGSAWVLASWLQRYQVARILRRPDLYEYSKASRRRSDERLQSPWGQVLLALVAVSTIAAVSCGAYWSCLEFGFVTTAIPFVVTAFGVVAVVRQYRKIRRADPDLWDWWDGEIRE